MYFSKIGIFIGILIIGMFASTNVSADPVSFENVAALRNDGSKIDLANNSGTTLFGSQIDFLVDIKGATPEAGVHTLRVTFQEPGLAPVIQTFRVPLFDGLPPNYSQLFTLQVQTPSFAGLPVTLTVALIEDISNSVIQSRVYDFSVAQPIPEPATSSLLILGAIGMWARRRTQKTRS
jgi:hypothetical protein